MNGAKSLEKKIKACLQLTENTQELAERGIAHLRQILEAIEPSPAKETYRRMLRNLQRIAKSCKSESEKLQKLLRIMREGSHPKPKPSTPPPKPTMVRVLIPKGLQIPDEKIKELVLQTLNGYAKEAEA